MTGFYPWISPETRFQRLDEPLGLDAGGRLRGVELAYRTWGELDARRDNAVVVCHALTGSADVDSWWPGLLGPGRALDPERDFVVAVNALGSCYGSTGPASRRPGSARTWGADFPPVTVRDQVRAQMRLLDRLGVERIRLVVGGSLGGMQALEWAWLDAGRVEAVAAISAPGRHGAWAIGLSELGRRAIALDPRFRGGRYEPDDPPRAGLALARAVAMTSYRSAADFGFRFGRDARGERFAVETYLAHQGEKLVARFDANAYLTLLAAMDSHDVARERGEYAAVLRGMTTPVLLVASSSDALYPPEETYELATLLPRAELVTLATPHGHDAFLVESGAVDRAVAEFRLGLQAGAAPGLAAGGAR